MYTREVTKKEAFMNAIREADNNNLVWFAIVVYNARIDVKELICFNSENFKEKLEYYESAYDSELILKNCRDIRILDWRSDDFLSEIELRLWWNETI